jgi:hypothetical protein
MQLQIDHSLRMLLIKDNEKAWNFGQHAVWMNGKHDHFYSHSVNYYFTVLSIYEFILWKLISPFSVEIPGLTTFRMLKRCSQ